MEEEAACEGGLVLGIGGGGVRPRKRPVKFHILFPIHSEMIGEGGQELDNRSSSRICSLDEEEEVGNKTHDVTSEERKRKKLRLSKQQLSLLEDSFIKHRTLTPAQKQELADRLNVSPRQVEVWFQNRRARTKMKQTEVDCEFLKKYCERLREENKRLRKELIDLRSMKLGSPLYVHIPRGPANKAMCPSCHKLVSPNGRKNSNTFHGAAKDASMAR